MRKSIIGFVAGAAATVLTVHCFPGVMPVTQRDINNETMNALLWMQTSAEYRALCYQSYNTALELVKAAKESTKGGDKPLAIILDCDETVLDNSPNNTVVIDNNSHETPLEDWRKEAIAETMPGAEEFLKAVDALGVEIFYVTNRPEKARADTMRNMKNLNFPQVDDRHAIFSSGESSKDSRFGRIEEDYNVVVYLGDSIHDFPMDIYGKMMQERNAITDRNSALFGKKYIVFPNPMYGHWLGALAEGYREMSPEEQHKAKVDALRIWRKQQ